MLSLPDAQATFAATILHGPGLCPEGLFAGTHERALLGLKVHANTVSHARLIALEETFPHTRETMGEAAFNAASRAFLDAGMGRSRSLTTIGADFPQWLEDAAGDYALLARFEWAWLEAYNAAEADALAPEVMADPQALLSRTLAPHPAARLAVADRNVAAVLGLKDDTRSVLIARPEAEVQVHQLSDAEANLFARFNGIAPVAQIAETFWAEFPNDDAAAGLNTLLTFGALAMETASC